ncbi:uncharacterized protein LOC119991488 [Tripterygium wilfordii]|uniref:uncharacterized protein LOC119991488 n=1 Tax=Tripterygium wilfordii TaxID=458696 RepID=UPI0018F7FE11|nr:uncharacterized protein LOC119991488 [Tripterygium wilfordii]
MDSANLTTCKLIVKLRVCDKVPGQASSFPKSAAIWVSSHLWMDILEHRNWMYNRLLPGRKGITDNFLLGVEEFISFACQHPIFLSEGKLRCPCSKHKNQRYLTPDEVKVDLYRKGFTPNYWYWTSHGEEEPQIDVEIDRSLPGSSSVHISDDQQMNRYQTMIFDAVGPDFTTEYEQNVEEAPNMDAQKFYDMLHACQKQLWPGSKHSELSVAVRMLSIKSDYNMSQRCFDEVLQLMKETNPLDNCIPSNFYQAKKLVSKLGLISQKIDCCVNGCLLYFKDNINLRECKFCGSPRYKPSRSCKKKLKDVPFKRLHYLPLIPRLKRLYASMSSASHMRWHYEKRRDEGVLCHPSDGEHWKHFDQTYPDFAIEPRNVRLGLCSDGFTPYSQSSSPYSCWPIIITPYNLPPEMCMTTPYMFLTCIIPGPHNPKSKIDVYLQPLIDELKLLWDEGVLTYDISRKQNFKMRAALMWTINDFPAYGMLSGWSTAGKLACPYCMNRSKAFTLKHGG